MHRKTIYIFSFTGSDISGAVGMAAANATRVINAGKEMTVSEFRELRSK